MNYKELAKTYHHEKYFYDNIEEFIETKMIEDIAGFKKEVSDIEKREEEQKRKIKSCIEKNFNAIKMQGHVNIIVIHKSTRKAGEYQITVFYNGNPMSDTKHKNKEELFQVLVDQYLEYEIKEIF